jgi:hypothetical protein
MKAVDAIVEQFKLEKNNLDSESDDSMSGDEDQQEDGFGIDTFAVN